MGKPGRPSAGSVLSMAMGSILSAKLPFVSDEAEGERGRRGVRFPFRRKLALAFAVLGVGPLAAIGALLIDANEDALRRSTLELQIAIADGVGATLAQRRADAERAAADVAGLLGDGSLGRDARLAAATERFERSELLRLTVLDAAGEPIDSWRRDATEPWDPLMVEAPIVDGSATRTGSVRGRVSMTPLRERMAAILDRHEGAADAILVLGPEGSVLVASAPGATAPALDVRLAELRAPRATETDRSIATLAPVPGDPPLAVHVETSPAAAFATLRRLRTVVIGSCVALALIALFVGLGIARRITRPLESLSRFAGALAERRFDAPLPVATGDEIGALAEDLRDTAEALAASEERIREEEAIRTDLGRYLAADLVERVVRREQTMELGGRRADITVLFADVVAFTPLSRALPPEDVVGLLNELFTLLTEAVFRHGGTVDKLVGDAVMAVFGAPAEDPDHARSALRTAEAMMAIVETAGAGWQSRYGVRLQLAIGVHSGEAVVGNVGSERRMDYTAIGDVVNLAARLETIARPQQILVSAATAERVGEAFDLAPVGERAVGERTMTLFEVRP
jgi:adenylate cyclase